ncbi:MAG: hypothetical protein ACN6PP_08280 [Delftia tsuruhatensis]
MAYRQCRRPAPRVLATYAVVFGVLMVLLSFKLKKGIRHSS